MTVYTPGLDREQLAALADDVRELTQEWSRQVWRSWHTWDRHRNRKTHRVPVTVWYPPLLDQLRAAVYPGGGATRGPQRRTVARSSLPISVDPSDRLARIHAELLGWRLRLELAPPRDREPLKGTLRQLVGEVARLDRRVAEELAGDVHRWWTWAARQAGHDADELLDTRWQHHSGR